MALISLKAAERPIGFSRLRALVIDDYVGMRGTLKMILSNFVMAKIERVIAAVEAIVNIRAITTSCCATSTER